MKIAYYTNIPSPYRVNFFSYLGKTYNVNVVFEMKKATNRDNGFEATIFNNFKAFFLKGIRYGDEASFCPGIIKWYKKNKPDINVVCNYSSLSGLLIVWYFVRHRIPYIIEGDGAFPKKCSLIKKLCKKYIFSHAIRLIYTSEEYKKYYLLFGAQKRQLWFSPFSSMTNKEITEASIVHHRVHKECRFISVGRFLDWKNFETIINAFSYVQNNSILTIIGGEPTDNYLKIIHERNIQNIFFEPFMDKNLVFDYFKKSDVFVFASTADIWGLVINEAMACGLPIIAGKGCLAAVELSKHTPGILLIEDSFGEIEFAENMKKVKHFSDNMIRKMSESNLKAIKSFSIDKMVENRIELFTIINKQNGKKQ